MPSRWRDRQTHQPVEMAIVTSAAEGNYELRRKRKGQADGTRGGWEDVCWQIAQTHSPESLSKCKVSGM